MTDHDPDAFQDDVRRRQKSRNLILALLLGAFTLLTFLIAMAKITGGQS